MPLGDDRQLSSPSPRAGWCARRRRASGSAVLLALLLLGACGEEAPSGPVVVEGGGPSDSVIFILIDTLRADHTSIDGHRHGRRTTPFLDQLADEGIVFQRAYSAASWTRASMASIFSSRLPPSHGCETRDGILVDEITTWVEVLQDGGWQTRAVITNGNVTSKHGFAQGFDAFRHEKDFARNVYADAWKLREPILETIDSFQPEEPFVLYLHYVDPHDPYVPHESTDYSPGYDGPIDGSRESLDAYSWEAPGSADKQRVLDLYDGDIQWFDDQLEMLFERLDDRGLLEHSWVVITSDHGEGLWDHRILAHGQEVFEHQIHVPLIVRPPGGLDRRVDVADPFSHIDLGPTLLDLLGQGAPAEFEGRSWAGFLRGRDTAPVRPVIVDERLDHTLMSAIIDGQDKLIIEYDAETEQPKSMRLFDLGSNPTERIEQSVDAREERSARAARLERLLVESLEEARAARPTGTLQAVEYTDEELANLKALGYLGDDPPPDDQD